MAIWWVALHALAVAALVVLAAPWLLKALVLLTVLVHAIALAPEPAPRVVYRSDGRIGVPERGQEDLTLGPRTLYAASWVRLDLRGAGHALDVLLLVDQVSPEVWRALQAELRRFRGHDGNGDPAK